ncbi:MAG: hypothetical protein HXS41_03730 [Theionarchaea archaeon]|nr:hypothetical protein [Theionarchaea archaeon]MBU7020147.1 hypothetical protein [Theionarchaea archaeon]MBU7035364.1 hypothetical protein [Theionarchaea archaeon]MBU7041746.1 hypothetical protein [Theionarchaea archaeon]
MIKSKLGEDVKILSPSRLSSERIRNWKQEVIDCHAVVGVSLEGKYTVSVWTVLEYAEKKKIPVYTVEVEEGLQIWREGVQAGSDKLTYEESRSFTRNLTLGSRKDILTGLFFGGRRRY